MVLLLRGTMLSVPIYLYYVETSIHLVSCPDSLPHAEKESGEMCIQFWQSALSWLLQVSLAIFFQMWL